MPAPKPVRRAPGSGPKPVRRAPARPEPPPPPDPETLLATPLGSSRLPGAATLRRAGLRLDLRTVRDILFHLPSRYEDRRAILTLAGLRQLSDGASASARVRVVGLRVEQTWRRRVQRTIASLADETGEAEAVWFGRRFIERRFREGDRLIVSGRVKLRGYLPVFDDPEFSREDESGADPLHAGRIVPVYRLTAGLTTQRLRASIRAAIDQAGLAYPEYLPADLRTGERLEPIGRAVEQVHFPDTPETLEAALRRLAFDELLALQLGMVGRRRQRGRTEARALAIDAGRDAAIRLALAETLSLKLGRPVELTVDQAKAIGAIRADLAGGEPMLRLLQGDVGSGKTAVAAYALAVAAGHGHQGALLAPTDLLARQHAATIGDLLAPLGIPVALLTGSLNAAATRGARQAIATGQAGVVVGTHALIQAGVEFRSLSVVVIDEQHRFGVDQRGQLEAKAGGTAPHVLLMTATPIPRTLGQVLYADLEVSDLRTPPEGRIPIATGIRASAELDGTWRRVREEADAGFRTFVVVPAIEESDEAGAVAAESEAVRLRELLQPLRVGLVHGRMKAADRDFEMGRFRDGLLDVLVGTTVVEVGVDVPEATLMVIEGADRFGLAQLHQLRGRVGRGTARSFCVLVSDTSDETALARLTAVRDIRDGFELAEKDFLLRREGDVLGLAQSGLPRLRVASLQRPEHRELAVTARRHAEALLGPAGELVGPGLAPLRHELEAGWLERIWAGEPASGA